MYLCAFLSSIGLGLKFSHAYVKNFPLVDLKRKLDADWSLGADTFGSDGVVHGLALSVIIVKFISESFLDHGNIVHWVTGVF